MPLLNYTTEISVIETVSQIQAILRQGKARSVSMEFDDDARPCGVAFTLRTEYGERTFMLPVRVDAVWRTLKKQAALGQIRQNYATQAQAERVAWRIIKDWLEAQLALVEADLAVMDEVMLPYMKAPNGELMYASFKAHELLLPSPTNK